MATFCVLHLTCVPGEANLPFGMVLQLLWQARSHITLAASVASRLTAKQTPDRVGARLLEGRTFTAADRDGSEPVVIVSRATGDGGRAGVKSEVTRAIAARMVSEQKADLAGEQEAAEYRAQMARKWRS